MAIPEKWYQMTTELLSTGIALTHLLRRQRDSVEPSTSGIITQMSLGRRRRTWSNWNWSRQERWVIQKEKDIEKVKKFIDLIGGIELTWLEAFVLLQHLYRCIPLAKVADMADKTTNEMQATFDNVIKKTAVALGYITETQAGINVKRKDDPIIKRRRQVKELFEQGLSQLAIGQELNTSNATVRKDLMAMGLLAYRKDGAMNKRREEVKALREQGLSQRAIAERVGVVQSTVRRDLKAVGMK